ncbi:MAG: dihydrolipoyllysine-residue succinyltransferase [Rhodobacteraceae bacterium]|jgi:2-oxoglutarate dehydrogenase E2 component (dihydrolipoamide succinyltransferase)|uniref:Dihydrolipoyllysine-residue succinyltransferase component of 2-oxoglutarate dehydrogenase complex n=1 Tax=Salipiger profundus TaxID=1229727 RepID=A0A1U7D1C3_9RHOB|nr:MULTISPECIES: 2-oxoglutarate dehydrogenase complex dihydrolipoyllysine-residue succinyltransferase [Salipiger]APX21941.1 2-oxoglutarate dehydrogenase E2 component [Salipiger profundus]MAB08116.1 dihydrolipoyllysine-residue succinyltransferase [Paracoccaceae bacterium]GGA06384.1 dihydrolipoyllysine-residue succinyltransferase component of 2-oxoglutarate dehydrogenase complex [Salipiger profundus]SFC37998.1 2-oxoglutarate dehydrogenase E2 component [Salipiger profundus]
MTTEVRVPTLGESVTEATVATWFKKPGDAVAVDEMLCELETDKVTVEVPSPVEGTLEDIVASEGDTVGVDALLANISPAGEAGSANVEERPSASKPQKDAEPEAEAGGEAIDVMVPTLGESVSEATVSTWFKKVGDSVEQDEMLCELETDKVSVEVPAPASGTLTEILADEGATVEAGGKLAIMSGGGAGSVAAPAPSSASADEPSPNGRKDVEDAPSAKKAMAEAGLDPKDVKGSGKDGRVMKEDVSAAIAAAKSSPAASSAPAQPKRAPSPAEDADREERVKMTRLRQTIAKRLKDAQNTAAMLTTYNEVDMTEVMALRSQYKDLFEKKHGVRLGFMSFFTKACVHALKEVPEVNAEIDGTEVVYKNFVHMGIAAGTPQGLVVPVIRDVDTKSFAEIEGAIAEKGKRARDGKLSMAEMQGGTFTISNGGVYGSLMSSPILNPPQSGILGMHKIQDRPMVINGEIKIRPMMYLALSYDHRIVDGKGAVTFLVRVKEALEDPRRLLMDL